MRFFLHVITDYRLSFMKIYYWFVRNLLPSLPFRFHPEPLKWERKREEGNKNIGRKFSADIARSRLVARDSIMVSVSATLRKPTKDYSTLWAEKHIHSGGKRNGCRDNSHSHTLTDTLDSIHVKAIDGGRQEYAGGEMKAMNNDSDDNCKCQYDVSIARLRIVVTEYCVELLCAQARYGAFLSMLTLSDSRTRIGSQWRPTSRKWWEKKF